jgi:two-component system, cell cycle sensor histidine kinase and response regulator CckA
MPKGPLSLEMRSLLWALFSLGLIHVLDRNTPAYVTLNALYTIPVMIAAWGMGKSGAFGLALLATSSWIYVSFLVTGPFTSTTSLAWIALTLFAGFIVPGLIVDLLRRRILSERDLRLSRAATEDKLLESNELLSLFVHHSPIYAYIKEVDSTQSRVLHASENFEQMVGLPGSEMVGKTMAELYPPAMAEKITADDRAVVSGGKELELQEEFDGRSYLTHKYPIVHGGRTLLAGFTIDITERKQAEASLAFTQYAVDHSALSTIWFAKETGQIVYVNQAASKLLGYSRDELLSLTAFEIDPSIPPSVWRSNFEVLKRLGSLHFESAHATKTGQMVPVEVSANYVEYGGLVYNCCFITDITKRKQAEAEKAELETLNHQFQKAQSLGVMAGSIAHHFNNKLQSVIGYLELLPQLNKDEDPIKCVALAKEAAEKAAEVSRLLLVYLGNTSASREPRSLSELCLQHVPSLQNALPSNVTLEPDCPSPGPVISANVDQIQRVLTNLVTNASESLAGAEGCIRIGLETCPAEEIPTSHRFPIDWKPQEPDYACLEVADTGSGITEGDIGKLFDPFFSTKFVGRGLGLPVVLGIVQAHGGAITVKSKQGRGSVFRVYIPVSTEPAISLLEGVVQSPEHEGGGTLLLVDDDDMLLMSTGALVERLGFTLLTARDGVDALEVFRQHRGEIRCVLTDLTMPRLDGWGLLSALRQLDPNLPVILASGYDKNQVLKGTHPYQPQAFLSKPFNLQQLRNALDQALATSSKG